MAIALCLELLNLGEQLSAEFIDPQKFANFDFVPCPAGGQAFAEEIGSFANQFDVEHFGIIGRHPCRARAKPETALRTDGGKPEKTWEPESASSGNAEVCV